MENFKIESTSAAEKAVSAADSAVEERRREFEAAVREAAALKSVGGIDTRVTARRQAAEGEYQKAITKAAELRGALARAQASENDPEREKIRAQVAALREEFIAGVYALVEKARDAIEFRKHLMSICRAEHLLLQTFNVAAKKRGIDPIPEKLFFNGPTLVLDFLGDASRIDSQLKIIERFKSTVGRPPE